MALKAMEEMRINMIPPVVGKIALGVKKVTASGFERPAETEFFVVDSLDEKYKKKIQEVYKENLSDLKKLDLIFPSDNINSVIPTWYKWYGAASKAPDGSTIGGRLRCIGEGPGLDGSPGVADYREKMDPVTRVVPKRPCLGSACPDYYNAKGQKQCKKIMQIFAYLPLITADGIFQIDTSSEYAIMNFHRTLYHIHARSGGLLRNQIFKLERKPENIAYIDNTGNQKISLHHIMKLSLHDKEEFAALQGEKISGILKKTFGDFNLPDEDLALQYPASAALIEAPEEPIAIEAAPPMVEKTLEQIAAEKLERSKNLLADPEVLSTFQKLEEKLGKKFEDKARLQAIRKKEDELNQKQAVLDALLVQLQA